MAALGAWITFVKSNAACHLVHFRGAAATACVDRERPECGRGPRCCYLATVPGKTHCPVAVDDLDRRMQQQARIPLVVRHDGEEAPGAEGLTWQCACARQYACARAQKKEGGRVTSVVIEKSMRRLIQVWVR